MNEAALLAACDAAPDDPVPRLILADCLEEAGTPGRAAAARLVRLSAKALQTGAPAVQRLLTRVKNRLSKARPCAVAWFEWWFLHGVREILDLHNSLDRRALAHFVLRCVQESPSRRGGTVGEHLGPLGRSIMDLLARFANGHDLTEADWASTGPYLSPVLRSVWAEAYAGVTFSPGWSWREGELLDADVLAVADLDVPWVVSIRAAGSASAYCAGGLSESWEGQRPIRDLHRRLLHECVPCPFDPEGDG